MQCCHTWILSVPESSKCFLPSSGHQVYCRHPWVWCPRLHLPPTTNHHLHPQGLCHLGNSRPLPHHPPAAWQPALHCLGNRVSVLQQYTVNLILKVFLLPQTDWLFFFFFFRYNHDILPCHWKPAALATASADGHLSRSASSAHGHPLYGSTSTWGPTPTSSRCAPSSTASSTWLSRHDVCTSSPTPTHGP